MNFSSLSAGRLAMLALFGAFIAGAQPVPGRYIVEFDGEPAAVAAKGRRFDASGVGVEARRSLIRAQHAAAAEGVGRLGGQVRHRIENVINAVIVEIPDSSAAALRTLPGVRAVHQDEQVRLHLTNALNVHNVPDAWLMLAGGVDGAGQGVKVGIIDSGIAPDHPGFQDPSLAFPAGFPKADTDANKKYANGKIVVLRNYSTEFDAADQNGHGSGVALAAAGSRHDSPLGRISGVAPKAWIGVYKVADQTGSSTLGNFLRALDDALTDGMDVVNYSAGATIVSSTTLQSTTVAAVERAFNAGLLITISAGNNGPDPTTIATPAVSPSAITVAASGNERIYSWSVKAGDAAPYLAIAGNGVYPATAIAGKTADLAKSGDGRACGPLDKTAVTGKIALIQRGDCNFSDKIGNADAAGAIAVIVYNNQPNALVSMNVGSATLPAVFITAEDAAVLRQTLDGAPDLNVSVDMSGFTPFPVSSNRMASFSSRGPSPVRTLKPDIAAVGTSFYTAAQKVNPDGQLYDPSGWTLTQGTSFSAPLVAGAAALIKSARPGLTVQQYRSLVINSARPLPLDTGNAPPTTAGAGLLDLPRAMQSTVAAFPASLDFGARSGTVNSSVDVKLSNVGTVTDTFAVSVEALSGPLVPAASVDQVTLDPGASQTVTLTISGTASPGPYTGWVKITGTKGAPEARLPYWLGVPDTSPSSIAIVRNNGGAARQNVTGAVYFRLLDSAGLPVDVSRIPDVTTDTTGARVLGVLPLGDIPGTFSVDVRMGATATNLTISVGNLQTTVVVPLN